MLLGDNVSCTSTLEIAHITQPTFALFSGVYIPYSWDYEGLGMERCSEQNSAHRTSDAQMHTVHEHFMQLFTQYTDSDRKQVFEQEYPETGSIFFLEECQIANCQVSDFF